MRRFFVLLGMILGTLVGMLVICAVVITAANYIGGR